jgi:cobalamin biosynthesis protein CobD/CbiB
MNNITEIICSNPLYATLAVLIAMIALWAVLKRLIRAAVVLLVCGALYAGYLNVTGKPLPRSGEALLRDESGDLERLRSYGSHLVRRAVELLGERSEDGQTRQEEAIPHPRENRR